MRPRSLERKADARIERRQIGGRARDDRAVRRLHVCIRIRSEILDGANDARDIARIR